MLGAESAFATAGASAGLIWQAAACMTGDDQAKITRLPDTRGMPNEIIIQRAHRFAYDQAYRVAGGILVEIGLARRTQPFELEAAITERTAAVAYLVSPFTSPPGILSLTQVITIARWPWSSGHRGRRLDAAAPRESDEVPPGWAPIW